MKEHKPKGKNPVIEYFEESWQELKKVSWPTRNKAVRLTILVLAFCTVAAVVIGAMDAVFNYGHQKLVEIAPASTTGITNDTTIPLTAESLPITAEATTTTNNQ